MPKKIIDNNTHPIINFLRVFIFSFPPALRLFWFSSCLFFASEAFINFITNLPYCPASPLILFACPAIGTFSSVHADFFSFSWANEVFEKAACSAGGQSDALTSVHKRRSDSGVDRQCDGIAEKRFCLPRNSSTSISSDSIYQNERNAFFFEWKYILLKLKKW